MTDAGLYDLGGRRSVTVGEPIGEDDARPDMLSIEPREIEALLNAHFQATGEPRYRVRQVMAWLFARDAWSFSEMTDLPAGARSALAKSFDLCAPNLERVELSDDGTAKQLWQLPDGELIESVIIPADQRLTLCISSQAGCAMGCAFCATGWSGYRRHLSTGEIIAQFRGARRWSKHAGLGRITNIVFMGMGEPLANPNALFPALTLLNESYGVGARRITVSTVGVVPGIRELADRPEQFRLALSLHAPNAELRAALVPIEKKYPMVELFEALRMFDARGGKRISFEYVMLRGINDALAHARQLSELVRPFRGHVNLIPYNPFPGAPWQPSEPSSIVAFAKVLDQAGVTATVRVPRGRDIAAACGQLRAEHQTTPPKPALPLLQRHFAD